MVSGFPHSEICGSKLVCQLPAAYRKLLRPSSPLTAKASTVCTYSLDHITPNGLFEMIKDFANSYFAGHACFHTHIALRTHLLHQ